MQQDDDVLAVGDKIEIVKDKDRTYKTMIEDMTGNGLFLVGMPSYGGMPVVLRKGDAFSVLFSRESGIYSTYMRVLGFEKKGDIRYTWLLQETRPRRYQRRGAYRLPVNLKVTVCDLPAHDTTEISTGEDHAAEPQEHGEPDDTTVLETAGTTDISVTGLALVVRREYATGGQILLKPQFPEPHSPTSFLVRAEVVRSIPERYRSRHCIGVEFIGQSKSMHEYLSRYILAQQQKQIRQSKFG